MLNVQIIVIDVEETNLICSGVKYSILKKKKVSNTSKVYDSYLHMCCI